MKKIIILTSDQLRHRFFRKWLALSDQLTVIASYCESGNKLNPKAVISGGAPESGLMHRHLAARECSEQDFFRLFDEATPDRSNPITIPAGSVNDPVVQAGIIASEADLLIAYGCSLIREPLLSRYRGRFINLHLGLSPYYRGAGTNYWPLVNGEPEYVGVTFMHIDAGVDSGEVIHQIQARLYPGDTPHQIGNRLIGDMAKVCVDLIRRVDDLASMPQIAIPATARLYRRKDYNEESVGSLYRQFEQGLIERYLQQRQSGRRVVPIVENNALLSES